MLQGQGADAHRKSNLERNTGSNAGRTPASSPSGPVHEAGACAAPLWPAVGLAESEKGGAAADETRWCPLPCHIAPPSDVAPPAKRARCPSVLDAVSHARGSAGDGGEQGPSVKSIKSTRGVVEMSCAVYALVTCERDTPGAVCCSGLEPGLFAAVV